MTEPLEAATERDRAIVCEQLGRPPRGNIGIVARCAFGLPLVIRTPSTLDDGTPFPTVFYLTCPVAARNASMLESGGEMARLNDLLSSDPALSREYAAAHDRYRLARDGDLDGKRESAGGMPSRVKCLHALYAHEIAGGNPIGALVRERIDPVTCPGVCVESSETTGVQRVSGHPGFRKRRP